MTQSYNIGGITPVNVNPYQQTEYDAVPNVNDRIDKYTKDMERYFTELVNQENARLDPKRSAGAKLVRIAKGLEKDAVPVINWAKTYRDINKFIKTVEAEENNQYEVKPDGRRFGPGADEDEQDDIQADKQLNLARAQAAGIVGKEGQYLFPNEIHNLLDVNGLTSESLGGLFQVEQAVKNLPVMMATVNGALRHQTGTRADGSPDYNVLGDTQDINKWEYMYLRNMGFVTNHLKDIAPRGKLKRHVWRELYKNFKKDRIAFFKGNEKAVKEHWEGRRAQEIQARIIEDPSYITTYIDIHKDMIGVPAAKMEAFGMVQLAVENNLLDGSDVEAIRNTKLTPYGGGKETTVGELFKPQMFALDSALQKVQSQEIKNLQSDENLQKVKLRDAHLEKLQGIDGPILFEEHVLPLLREYQDTFKTTQNPEYLNSYLTAEAADDLETDRILTQRYMRGETLKWEDYYGIKDPVMWDKWKRIIGGPGMSADEKSKMEAWIRPVVNTHINENDGPLGRAKSLKWEANMLNATDAYVATFLAARGRGLNEVDSRSEARRAVLAGLTSGDFDTQAHTEKSDISKTNLLRKHRKLISKDLNLIDSPEPLDGEDEHILAAARYFAKNPNQKNLPDYFYHITKGMKISPYQYAKRRLVATGRLKDGELVFPEEKNLDAYDQEKLSYHPSDSRTYQVTQDNEDITWMLDLLKENSPAIANGEYQSIRNPDGEYVELERPITELTVGEVLELANLGYTNIGMYDLKPQALKQVVAMGGLKHDDVFDENTQDLVVLARLRYKANTRNNTRGIVNQYRRLVHIDREDHAEFVRIAGELPPWLRLENLIPDAAKAVVDETLNN